MSCLLPRPCTPSPPGGDRRHAPLRLLVPVRADEVGGVDDDPEAFFVQQEHHLPLKPEEASESINSTSRKCNISLMHM